ncbi:hypothetical protein ACP8HI_08700 [Paenibacillus sp. FA6]|uniref:hypothetical protein n=1 Tax=Paenibacillus sp. FA6 TaxID=3413029 RepID=UPI003F658446
MNIGIIMEIILQSRNVFAALQDIKLEIQAGEFIGIMGPVGADKTTLGLCMAYFIYCKNNRR